MVLWEITLGTAYFLGLRRTYKLALRIQRRIVGPNHPEIRQFLHRRTRSVFNVAVRVHESIQQRDIEVGRNLGNWILRWLDHVKPSALIRAQPASLPTCSNNIPKHVASSGQTFRCQRPIFQTKYQERKVRSFFSPWNIQLRSFPTIAMMMQPLRPAGMNGQYRYASHYMPSSSALDYRIDRVQSIFRKDIALWMLRN
ncbi:Peroxidase 6 [Cocos nucifera]|nr:Peroxidase 6 [Cocos nucifera]